MARARGSGSVTYENGKFVARIRLPDGTRPSVGRFETQDDADRCLSAAVANLRGTMWEPGRGVTLAAYGADWLDLRERTHRGVHKERSLWRKHVALAPFFERSIAKIERLEITRWVRSLERAKVGRKVIKNALSLLRQCFEQAIVDERVVANPALGIRVKRAATTKEEFDFLRSQAEIDAVIFNPKIPEKSRLVYTFAIYTGLRQGEIWGLHWEDVVLDGACPEVIVRYSFAQPTKGGLVKRTPLVQPAQEALRRWQEMSGRKTGLVWPNKDGGVHSEGYTAGWRGFAKRKKGGITQGRYPGHREVSGCRSTVVFHSFRHTCAVHLLTGTWAPQYLDGPLTMAEVSTWLRHASVSVTEKFYAKLAPGALYSRVVHKPATGKAAATVGPEIGPVGPDLRIN